MRAHRWNDTCEHQTENSPDDRDRCLTQMLAIGPQVDTLEIEIVEVVLAGSRADVGFRSTLGFEHGVAKMELHGARWLISGFRPLETP